MIKQRDIRAFNVRYHRNGVAGNGFHACSFLYLRGKNTIEMRAAVFPEPGNVAVMSNDIADRWCGDDFEKALRDAIELVEKAQPETIHSVEPAI